ARHDPRQEPGAVVPHAGICAGGLGNRHPYRDRLTVQAPLEYLVGAVRFRYNVSSWQSLMTFAIKLHVVSSSSPSTPLTNVSYAISVSKNCKRLSQSAKSSKIIPMTSMDQAA